jgi:hypothetical protein
MKKSENMLVWLRKMVLLMDSLPWLEKVQQRSTPAEKSVINRVHDLTGAPCF